MLQRIHIQGYRSLYDLDCNTSDLTVISGPNGVGKSNFYKALSLVKSIANGEFGKFIADEGGFNYARWAGPLKAKDKRTINILIDHTDFIYEIEVGSIPCSPDDLTLFRSDPDIKSEKLSIRTKSSKRVVASRKSNQLKLLDSSNDFNHYDFPLLSSESLLSQIKEPTQFPFIAMVRETINSWRFFHEFDTAKDSSLRLPQVAYWSPQLNDDGSNLVNTLQTLIESSREEEVRNAFQQAFPNSEFSICLASNRLSLLLLNNGLERPLELKEVSDGTLRYLCLIAALSSQDPPSLLVFNEPEMSLNENIFPALISMLKTAASKTQVIVVTHAQEISASLSSDAEVRTINLILQNGATILAEHAGSNKVWSFD